MNHTDAVQSPLEQHALNIINEQGFVIESTLSFGLWYNGNPRSLVYGGKYHGKDAVLKVYNEVHPANQPEDLLLFQRSHTSTRMYAPELYAYEVESPHAAWMIMEKIPQRAQMLRSPMSVVERAFFLDAFIEYRTHFSLTPTREAKDLNGTVVDVRSISAGEFHRSRIKRWQKIRKEREAEYKKEGKSPLFNDSVHELCAKVEERIFSVFKGEPMYWCHGHMKPNEVHYDAETTEFWVTDYAHMTIFPAAYEFAFMIWADALVEFGDYDVTAYVARIDEWVNAYQDAVTVAIKTGHIPREHIPVFQYSPELLNAAILERCIGALYADVIGRVDNAYDEKPKAIQCLVAVMEKAYANEFGNI